MEGDSLLAEHRYSRSAPLVLAGWWRARKTCESLGGGRRDVERRIGPRKLPCILIGDEPKRSRLGYVLDGRPPLGQQRCLQIIATIVVPARPAMRLQGTMIFSF